MAKSITSTRTMTRRVVMSDNFLPTRVSDLPAALGPLMPGSMSCSSSRSSCKKSSSCTKDSRHWGPEDSSMPFPGPSFWGILTSMAVVYVLYSLTSRNRRRRRNIRPALAPARPARLDFTGSLPSVEQNILSPIQVRSKMSVTVVPTSKVKKNPRKYSSFPSEAATISNQKTPIHKIVRMLNILSVFLYVTAKRKSSPNKAYIVSAVVNTQKRQLSHRSLLRCRTTSRRRHSLPKQSCLYGVDVGLLRCGNAEDAQRERDGIGSLGSVRQRRSSFATGAWAWKAA
mmetsp:Transcript_83480/g.232910  ORF Transcript_83480/g.232910 Transcript_83480/m.232910 type:complete len:285 (+) Transcript_83480:1958-2812(+)